MDVDSGLDGRSSAMVAHAASSSSSRKEHCLIGAYGNSQYSDVTSAHKALTLATASVGLVVAL